MADPDGYISDPEQPATACDPAGEAVPPQQPSPLPEQDTQRHLEDELALLVEPAPGMA